MKELTKLDLPVTTVSETNQRCHWTVKARRVKTQRYAVAYCWLALPVAMRVGIVQCIDTFGLTVTLVRVGGRRMDDDNLRAAFKAIRDELAKQMAVDDGDPAVRWNYRQQPGKRKATALAIFEVTNG
jgi:hypothetical protein